MKGAKSSKGKHSLARSIGSVTTGRLEITPARGEFVNFNVDTTYVMSFTLRNMTHEMQTLRFVPPQSSKTAFRLLNQESVRLAPGIAHVVDVEFSAHVSQDYEDSFVVLTEKGVRVVVPLVAWYTPALEFASVLNFGRVECSSMGVSRLLQIANRGRKDATVTLTPDPGSGIRVSPSVVVAHALGDTSVTVELGQLVVGQREFPLMIDVDGETERRMVMVHVDVVDCRSRLVDPRTGKEAVSITFDKVYAGSKKSIDLVVANGSEQGVSFAFQPAGDGSMTDPVPFRVMPVQGRLGPKEQRRVHVIFEPQLNCTRTGWSSQQESQPANARRFEALFSLLFVETEQTHNFYLSGESADTQAWLSCTLLNFGSCPMNDYRDVEVHVHNGAEELPLQYKFSHVAHFRVDKAAGSVPPNSSVRVMITYHPRRLGKFSEQMKVSFNNSTVVRNITLVGDSVPAQVSKTKIVGGPDKLPEDFARKREQPSHKHAAIKEPPAGRATAPPPRAAVDLPCEVDIGMVPGEGLNPPQPAAHRPDRELRDEDAAVRMSSGHVAPPTFDTKSLIKRRFSEVSSSTVERRDIRRELMPMDLLKIVAPIKQVEFGRMTVNATATKPFFVYNGTGGAVLASMPSDNPNIRFTPMSQVIPSGRMAEFDVTFFSSLVQTCQQVIHMALNRLHRMRFTLHAEVVPVEVSLSSNDMIMNFAEFTDEPTVKATVTLTNGGSSDAAYRWHLPSKAPFVVQPVSGLLPATSKAVSEITFTPPQGLLEVPCDAYLEVDGAAERKLLRLTGLVAPTTCVWGRLNTCQSSVPKKNNKSDMHVDFRRIPAGRFTAASVFLSNRGHTNAFFSFDALPQGVQVTPSRGRVCASETEELIVSVKLDHVGTVNHVIPCCVRGMKAPLRIMLSAVVVAPMLSIVSPATLKGELYLDYGQVFVGAEKTLSVRLRNSGDVSAVIQLDCQDHPGFSVRQLKDEVDEKGIQPSAEVQFIPAGGSSSSRGEESVAQSSWAQDRSISRHVELRGLYLITISPNSEADVCIAYTPQSVNPKSRSYASWSQFGADDVNVLPPLVLAAAALSPPIGVSMRDLSFPTVIAGHLPKTQTFVVQNYTREEVQWRIVGQTKCDGACHFRLEPGSGVLSPEGSQVVVVTFLADDVGAYIGCFELYVEDMENMCCAVTVAAAATKPCLLCDRSALLFPPVPLGVDVRETVYLTNEGFDSIGVSYDGDSKGLLTVAFPKGRVLSLTTSCIPVEIVLCSPRPITFNSTIVIGTSNGEHVVLTVVGTSINSILTTQPFVRYMENMSSISSATVSSDLELVEPFVFKKNGPANVPCVIHKENVHMSGPEAQAYCMIDAVGRFAYSRRAVELLTRWMNASVLHEPVDNIIEALQSTHGALLFDLIERLFGKRPHLIVPSNESTTPRKGTRTGGQHMGTLNRMQKSRTSIVLRGSTRPLAAASARGVKLLETLLSFIKAYGGCLSEVELPYLLPYSEYTAHMKQTLEQHPLEPTHRLEASSTILSVSAFQARASHAWTVVVLQTLRIFYVSRLKLASLLQSKSPVDWGRTATLQSVLEGGNVYSLEEGILLQWLRRSTDTYLASPDSLFAAQPISLDNFTQLRNCRPLIATVLLYVPSVRDHFVRGDRKVFPAPSNVTENETNAYLLIQVLIDLGIPTCSTPRDMLEFSQSDWVLFTASLCFYLNRFTVKTQVLFEGKLFAPITRRMEVSNTSSVIHRYLVKLDNTAFKVGQQEISVAPNSVAAVEIIFTPKFYRVVSGCCLLLDQSPIPSEERMPFVFDLYATPTMEPAEVVRISTPLYEPTNGTIPVVSPFAHDTVVTVCISQRRIVPTTEEDVPEQHFVSGYTNAFFVSTDVLQLRCGETSVLPFHFVPLARGRYELKVTFRDDKEGEFSYLVEGECTVPKPCHHISFRTELHEPCHPSVALRWQNTRLERTVRVYEERCRQLQKHAGTIHIPDMAGNAYTVRFVGETFESPNPFFEAESNVVVLGDSCDENTVRFEFKPKYVGIYRGNIVLSSPVDVRIISFLGECVPKGERTTLKFTCPARQSISQNITVTNTSVDDWLVSATLDGDSFSGLGELRVPSGKRKEYPLKYSPAWIGKENGQLVLYNNVTGQKHTYTLIGEAEAPLSEDIITLDCRARERKSVQLSVPNTCTTDATFFVETDVPFSEGESVVIVPRGAIGKYTLTVVPTMGGTYSGKVVFKSQMDRYVWYVVNVHVAPPEKEGTVVMKTDVRTPILADVRVHNPLNKNIVFLVTRVGAGLCGDNTLVLEADGTSTYSCVFNPAHVGSATGRLSFRHEEVGEFWYELQMEVEDAPAEELVFESPLGKPCAAQVVLPNATGDVCQMMVHNTNPSNFSVLPTMIDVEPYSEVVVEISYTPTAVGVEQIGSVTLSNALLGQWKYTCRGVGRPPTASVKRSCVCDIASTTTVPLPFTNSLDVATPLVISIKGNAGNYFSLPKAPNAAIPSGAEITLTLAYSPKTVGQHTATVEVRPSVGQSSPEYDVVWIYPVEGMAEWRETTTPYRFRCAARKQFSDVIILKSPGLTEGEKTGATLFFEPDPKQHYLPAVRTTFECELVKDNPYPDAFQAAIRFSPLRPLAVSGELVVRGACGGSWRYRTYLEAYPSPVDDVIHLASAINIKTSVVFDLYNVFPYKSKFAAYFTSDSSRDFEVSPANGVLLPFVFGNRSPGSATPIRISFQPSTRVPRVEGTLVVDTEDMQWSFRVIGKLESKTRSAVDS